MKLKVFLGDTCPQRQLPGARDPRSPRLPEPSQRLKPSVSPEATLTTGLHSCAYVSTNERVREGEGRARSLRWGRGLGSASLPERSALRGRYGGPAPTSVNPARALQFLVLPHPCSASLCLEISSVCTAFPNTVFSQTERLASAMLRFPVHPVGVAPPSPTPAFYAQKGRPGHAVWTHVSRVSDCEQ